MLDVTRSKARVPRVRWYPMGGLWHGWLVSLIDLNNGIDLTALSEALVINNGKVCVIQWPLGRFINLSGRAGKFGQCEGNQRLLNNRSPHPRMAFTWTRNQRPAKQSSFTYLSIFWFTLSSVTLPSYCDYLIYIKSLGNSFDPTDKLLLQKSQLK